MPPYTGKYTNGSVPLVGPLLELENHQESWLRHEREGKLSGMVDNADTVSMCNPPVRHAQLVRTMYLRMSQWSMYTCRAMDKRVWFLHMQTRQHFMELITPLAASLTWPYSTDICPQCLSASMSQWPKSKVICVLSRNGWLSCRKYQAHVMLQQHCVSYHTHLSSPCIHQHVACHFKDVHGIMRTMHTCLHTLYLPPRKRCAHWQTITRCIHHQGNKARLKLLF